MDTHVRNKFKKVMVVDDNGLDRFIIEKMITTLQYAEEVILFFRPADALRYIQDSLKSNTPLPDLVFVDLIMHEMNGLTFIRAFRSISGPIADECTIGVLTSSYFDLNVLITADQERLRFFLNKPIGEEMLMGIQMKHGNRSMLHVTSNCVNEKSCNANCLQRISPTWEDKKDQETWGKQ